MSKNLIIYYSRRGQNYVDGSIKDLEKGNVEVIVEYIKNTIDCDLFEIKTVKEYSKDYMTCIKEAKEDISNNERPKLKEYLDSIDKYENIVVAGPCWWGTYPYAIFSQLEKLNFASKNVFPIMSHEGSGLANSVEDLKKNCKGATIKEGLAIKGSSVKQSKDVITRWTINNLK